MQSKLILLVIFFMFCFLGPGSQLVAVAKEDHHEDEGRHHDQEGDDDFWGDNGHDEEYHGHIGAHGGQFGDASNMYHYEVLVDEKGDVLVYMYDGEANPIADIKNMEARWTLSPDSEYPVSGVLALSKNKDYFILDLPAHTSKYVSVKIEAKKDGQWWPVQFLLACEHIYQPAGAKVYNK